MVGLEDSKGVYVTILLFLYNDMASFEEMVSFMRKQVKFILIFRYDNGRAFGKFLPVSEFNVIGKA